MSRTASTTSIQSFNYATRLAILSIAFVCGVVVTSLIVGALGQSGSNRTIMLLTVVAQNVLTFGMPALFTAWILTRRPIDFLKLDHTFTLRAFISMVVIYALGLPFLNQLVVWNEGLSLPASMSSLEMQLKALEDAAREVSDVLLGVESAGAMLAGVAIVGCLTGLCEELFFRGALQRLLSTSGSNIHIAVWGSAFIFSLMHFQFFGFFPRLILGAYFGYLFAWSGSIWLSAAAHALNNSLVVVTAWLAKRGYEFDLDKFGTITDGIPWFAIVSAIIVVAVLSVGYKRIFERVKR